jgi:hypothetical protein
MGSPELDLQLSVTLPFSTDDPVIVHTGGEGGTESEREQIVRNNRRVKRETNERIWSTTIDPLLTS